MDDEHALRLLAARLSLRLGGARVIPAMGLVGAPLLLASNTATMFGVNDQFSVLSLIALPGIFFWELSLGIYLAVKGFRPAPILATDEVVRVPAPARAEPAGA